MIIERSEIPHLQVMKSCFLGLRRPLDGGLRLCGGYVESANARTLVEKADLTDPCSSDRTNTGDGPRAKLSLLWVQS